MRQRWDGSVQSSNTPTFDRQGIPRDDFGLYRCMIIKVLYVDDPANISQKSQNPEVLYDVVILGGHLTGNTLSNCRLAQYLNYSERTLTATSKDISKVRLSQHDGDVVWVQFVQGHDGYPTIIALAKGISDKTGARKAEGPRLIEEYNGLVKTINKDGEYSIVRKGGSASNGRFTAKTAEESSISLKLDELVEIKTKSSGKFKIAKDKIAIGASGVELLQKISDALDKIITWTNNTGATHTHIGNLGYPTMVPDQAAQYTALGSDLETIKSAIDSIKGSL